MKRLEKTSEITNLLRKSYGPDAKLDNLVVFEMTLANTLPLRKGGGLFKGARLAASLLQEIMNAVNLESIPAQFQHDTQTLPKGRFFAAKMYGLEEVRGLVAVDESTEPLLVAALDSGTVDQVSVGMINKHLTCSTCGFDYQGEKAWEFRYAGECDKEHKIGENGVHVVVAGLDSLFETSFVGRGAVNGARVVGPSDSIFQNNQALAASAAGGNNVAALFTATLATPEEPKTMDLTILTTQLTSAVAGEATAKAQVTTLTAERDAATGQVTTLTAERNDALAAKTTAETALAAVTTERDAATTSVTAAVTALTAEATAVLTACGKSADDIAAALKDKDAPALLTILQENRKHFAAVIPVGGVAKAADTTLDSTAPARRAGAFSTRRPS